MANQTKTELGPIADWATLDWATLVLHETPELDDEWNVQVPFRHPLLGISQDAFEIAPWIIK